MSLTPTERAAYLAQADAIVTDGDGPVFCLATLLLDQEERLRALGKTTGEIPAASNGGTKHDA